MRRHRGRREDGRVQLFNDGDQGEAYEDAPGLNAPALRGVLDHLPPAPLGKADCRGIAWLFLLILVVWYVTRSVFLVTLAEIPNEHKQHTRLTGSLQSTSFRGLPAIVYLIPGT